MDGELEVQYLGQKFGDFIAADHKVLNEGHNHRYSVVVQFSATQWIQSYPCKTKTSQGTEKYVRKFLEPAEKPKVIQTMRWNLANPAKIHHGIIELLHLIDPRRMESLKEQRAELLQSGLDEKWWADSMECYCYLRNDLLADEKTPYERRFGGPFDGPVIPF